VTTAVKPTTAHGTDGCAHSADRREIAARERPALSIRSQTYLVAKQKELLPHWQSIYQTTLMWEEILRGVVA